MLPPISAATELLGATLFPLDWNYLSVDKRSQAADGPMRYPVNS